MKIHICMTTDARWFRFAERAIYDIIIRRNPETELKFYLLLDGDFDTADIEKFNAIDGVEVVTQQIDVKAEFGELPNYPYHYIGKFKHLKFLIPELPLFEGVERVLYLDVDILVRKDLTELYTIDLDDKALGCVRDYYNLLGTAWQGNLALCGNKIESGFAIMDLPKLCEKDFVSQCKEASVGVSGDVPVINAVYFKLAKLLDPKFELPFHEMTVNPGFNFIDKWNHYCGTNYQTINELVEDSVMWHFSGDKEYMYLGNTFIQTVFRLSESRLVKFLRTGEVMKWTADDDANLVGFLKPVFNGQP